MWLRLSNKSNLIGQADSKAGRRTNPLVGHLFADPRNSVCHTGRLRRDSQTITRRVPAWDSRGPRRYCQGDWEAFMSTIEPPGTIFEAFNARSLEPYEVARTF